MKYRITTEDTTFEAEKTVEEFKKHLEDPEDTSIWTQIDKWSKKYPIL